MLDNPPIFVKTEEIHGHVMHIVRPYLMRVKRHQITLGNGT